MLEIKLGKYRDAYAAIYYDEAGKRHRHSLGTADRGVAQTRLEAFRAHLTSKALAGELTTGAIFQAYLRDREEDDKSTTRMKEYLEASGAELRAHWARRHHKGHLDAIHQLQARAEGQRRHNLDRTDLPSRIAWVRRQVGMAAVSAIHQGATEASPERALSGARRGRAFTRRRRHAACEALHQARARYSRSSRSRARAHLGSR